MDPRLSALQTRLGYRFSEEALLERALRHRSFGADHNERLEFLGDAVLSLAISSLLFERFARPLPRTGSRGGSAARKVEGPWAGFEATTSPWSFPGI